MDGRVAGEFWFFFLTLVGVVVSTLMVKMAENMTDKWAMEDALTGVNATVV